MTVTLGQITKVMKSKSKIYPPFNEELLPIVEDPAVAYNAYSKSTTSPLSLLGIDNSYSSSIESTTGYIHYIRQGIPKKALDHLATEINLPATEISGILHTSERTLRRYAPSQKLNTEQSERVLELACLYAKGADVFEDIEQFKTWMASPVGALGNKKPKEFLDTSMGIAMLTEELGRIEHGIFA